MDPVTIAIIAIGIGGAIAISAAAALIFWPKVVKWAEANLLPWVKEHIPAMEDDVRYAFNLIDKFAVPLHALIKEKWQLVRQYLLRQVEIFEQQPDHSWQLSTISWFRAKLEETDPDQLVIEEIKTVREVRWEDLPAEVREAALRRGATTYEIDFTRERDAELGLELSA